MVDSAHRYLFAVTGGGLLILAKGSALAPLIYTLF